MMQPRIQQHLQKGDRALTGQRATAKARLGPLKLELLGVWKELFPIEAYESEPESESEQCINIDLELDQMENYVST